MKLNDMPVLYFDEILNGSVNIFSKKPHKSEALQNCVFTDLYQ